MTKQGGKMAADRRTIGERISDVITEFGGSWKFIITFSLIMVIWIIINIFSVFQFVAWDAYPFILLNLILSFVAAFQAPFIMMSQNRAEAKQDEVYRQLFYEIRDLVQQGNENSRENKDNIHTLQLDVKILKQLLEKEK